jgi:hypothetical protein
MKSLPTEEFETLLLQWFQQMRSEEFPISGPVLQEKATTTTLHMKIENFTASNGWLEHLKESLPNLCMTMNQGTYSVQVKWEPCQGGGGKVKRMTALLPCNFDESENLKPLVIGKYAKLR